MFLLIFNIMSTLTSPTNSGIGHIGVCVWRIGEWRSISVIDKWRSIADVWRLDEWQRSNITSFNESSYTIGEGMTMLSIWVASAWTWM